MITTNGKADFAYRRYIVAALAMALAIFALGILPAPASAADESIRPAVVLGHYPAGPATPTPIQNARCFKALELYRDGTINRIIVTGGHTRAHISEARMMKIALVAYGIPPEHVFEEDMAGTTVENGIFSAMLFDKLGWKKRAMLISQASHLWRAKVNFQDSGFEVKNRNAGDIPTPEDYEMIPKEEEAPPVEDVPAVTVVFEPYKSKEVKEFPDGATGRRLRAAAQLYREGKTQKVLVFADWYTRSHIDLPEMMQVALIALGVPEEDIIMKGRVHYSGFGVLAAQFDQRPALIITGSEMKDIFVKDSDDFIFWYLD